MRKTIFDLVDFGFAVLGVGLFTKYMILGQPDNGFPWFMFAFYGVVNIFRGIGWSRENKRLKDDIRRLEDGRN